MSPLELILMIGMKQGFGVVSQLLQKAGGDPALSAEDEKVVGKGIDLLKGLISALTKERGTQCWYDNKIECRFKARPICGLKANWISDKKDIADIQISDLENCIYRSDKEGV